MNKNNRLSSVAFHPLLIALYPALALLGHNIEEIKFTVGLRTVMFCLAGGLLVWGLVRWRVGDPRRAALLTTLGLTLFFSYGHVYSFVKDLSLSGLPIGRHRLLLPLWLALAGLVLWWGTRPRRDLPNLTASLNLIAAVLLIFPVFQILTFEVRAFNASHQAQVTAASAVRLAPGQTAPDIYYIILDAYSREDVLQSYYGLDNSPFVDQLTRMGFYVARCSQSNYAQTQLSLSSSLNMNYLSELGEQFKPGSTSRVGLAELIRHNAVRSILQDLGYKTVAFETGYKGTQWEDADLYLSPDAGAFEKAQFFGGISDFEVLFLRTTASLVLVDGMASLPKSFQQGLDNARDVHRRLVLYDLEELRQLPDIPGPKLVFAHIVIPHRPFVFGPNGESTDPAKDDIAGYRDQVLYINQQIVPILEQIIAKAKTPPIIVLQGDHGGVDTSPEQRMRILNAYYLPESEAHGLHAAITPVNTFRIIFNTYFNASYPLLEDRSYFSIYQTPFEYREIQNSECIDH